MGLRDKVEKIILEMGNDNFSQELRGKFMKSLKKDIAAALDENKKKYEEFLDERLENFDKEIRDKVDKYLEEKKNGN